MKNFKVNGVRTGLKNNLKDCRKVLQELKEIFSSKRLKMLDYISMIHTVRQCHRLLQT